MIQKRIAFSSGNGIVSLFISVLVLVGFYYLAVGLFKILAAISPVLLICSLIFNYNVVLDHVKELGSRLSQNPIFGILIIILNILAFPFVIGYLFVKSIFSSSWLFPQKEPIYSKRQATEYTEYEELPVEDESSYNKR